MAGGEPYGCMIGDFEFTNHPEDIDLLTNMSNVAAAGFCPFISAAGAGMFGFDSFTELSKPRDLGSIFEAQEYIKWRSFRDSEDSRFVTLRSEEHTSELQSRPHLVCRLLLEKKNNN